MNAQQVAEYAMADYVAESDAEPARRIWFSRREVAAFIVIALLQLGAYAWQAAQTREANDRATAERARADLAESHIDRIETMCGSHPDGSGVCQPDTFKDARNGK